MKKFVAISILSSLFLWNCNNEKKTMESTPQVQEKPVAVPEKFVVDSVKVDDSLKIDKNLTLGFRSKLLVFPLIKDSVLLDSIYAKEQIHASIYSKANLLKELQAKKTNFYDETKNGLKEYKPQFKQTWINNSDMNIFSNKNDLLTIKYTGDGFTGGAHGYYYEFYKVFDLKNNRTLHLSDILSEQDHKIWSRILMDNFLKNDLGKGQAQMLLVKQIPLTENFYLGDQHLYFLYNQYEITAYAAGTVLIKVPFTAIKPLLKNEFKTRLGLK